MHRIHVGRGFFRKIGLRNWAGAETHSFLYWIPTRWFIAILFRHTHTTSSAKSDRLLCRRRKAPPGRDRFSTDKNGNVHDMQMRIGLAYLGLVHKQTFRWMDRPDLLMRTCTPSAHLR